MDMFRQQIVRPMGHDIQYHVSRHQKYKQVEGEQKMQPDGDPYAVVELFVEEDRGELKRIDRFTMADFVKLSREVVAVGKELLADKDKKDDGDEPSVS
jgi:hypothetical protein